MKKVIMIGLHETGKTTFLAALWHIVQSNNCQLTLNKLPTESEYINDISSKWVNCEPLERTVLGPVKIVDMELNKSGTNDIINLIFPDLSGETFNTHFNQRSWDHEYLELIEDVQGLLLFIHPDKVEEPRLISDVQDALADSKEEKLSDKEQLTDIMDWEPNISPTQVKLVDILQFHVNHNFNNLINIAVIISAWDCVTEKIKSPCKWLNDRLPLLYQFLKSNNNTIIHKVYGVSAQGGNINNEKEKDELLKKINAIDRIIIKDDEGNNSDLTTPLTWLLGY